MNMKLTVISKSVTEVIEVKLDGSLPEHQVDREMSKALTFHTVPAGTTEVKVSQVQFAYRYEKVNEEPYWSAMFMVEYKVGA